MTNEESLRNDLANIKLASNQARELIGDHRETTQKLDTKLSIGITICGVFLKLSDDLPQDAPTYILCKAITIVGCIACAGLCLYGIWPQQPKRGRAEPSIIIEDWFNDPNERVIARITKTDISLEKELKERSYRKAQVLRWALLCLTASVIATGISKAVLLFFK